MFEVTRLEAPFGVAVTGIDLDSEGHRPEVVAALARTLHANRLVVVKGQHFETANYLAFGRQWGAPIVHVLARARMEGFPEVFQVTNAGETAREERFRLGAVFWHTDQVYETEPASATMLYCLKTPSSGGETLLADMAAAYDALPAKTRAELEGLRAVHFYGAASGLDGEYHVIKALKKEEAERNPPVTHPLVLPHPVTGRKALYGVAGTPFAIEGLPDPEARALLAELKRHALQPQFVHRHRYEVGDLAIWDTFATLHSAVPIDYAEDADNERLLWRISCRRLPPVLGLPPYRGALAADPVPRPLVPLGE